MWDSEKKRWINLEEEGSETNNEIKPPPKMSDMLQKAPSMNAGSDQLHAANPLDYSIESVPAFSSLPSFDSHVDNVDLGQITATQPPASQAAQDFRGYRTQPSPAPSPAAPITNQSPAQAGISENAGLPPKPTQPNMFKMQRNRSKCKFIGFVCAIYLLHYIFYV